MWKKKHVIQDKWCHAFCMLLWGEVVLQGEQRQISMVQWCYEYGHGYYTSHCCTEHPFWGNKFSLYAEKYSNVVFAMSFWSKSDFHDLKMEVNFHYSVLFSVITHAILLHSKSLFVHIVMIQHVVDFCSFPVASQHTYLLCRYNEIMEQIDQDRAAALLFGAIGGRLTISESLPIMDNLNEPVV